MSKFNENKKTEISCEDCGSKNFRAYCNGDEKVRCEQCAVKKYRERVGSALIGRTSLKVRDGLSV